MNDNVIPFGKKKTEQPKVIQGAIANGDVELPELKADNNMTPLQIANTQSVVELGNLLAENHLRLKYFACGVALDNGDGNTDFRVLHSVIEPEQLAMVIQMLARTFNRQLDGAWKGNG